MLLRKAFPTQFLGLQLSGVRLDSSTLRFFRIWKAGIEFFFFLCKQVMFSGLIQTMERDSDYLITQEIMQEIMNLEKDFENREESMSALRNYVQQMEPGDIHSFLTHLFNLQEQQDQKPYCIFMCELIAREHGKSIIPYISNIMKVVVKIVSSSPSESLRQSCAKAVSAVARYTIDIGSSPAQIHNIFRDIVNPLLDSLLGTIQCVAEASAFCFIALVETAAWKSAPNEIVNSLCLTVTSAMQEKTTQTSYHMKLVECLARCNGLILEGFCRSLLSAGAEIVDDGASSGNLKQQLNALQMIGCLLQHVKLVASDLEEIILSLEKWSSDRLLSIRSVARDLLQMALEVQSEIGKSENDALFARTPVSCESARRKTVLKEIDNSFEVVTDFNSPFSSYRLFKTPPPVSDSGTENMQPSVPRPRRSTGACSNSKDKQLPLDMATPPHLIKLYPSEGASDKRHERISNSRISSRYRRDTSPPGLVHYDGRDINTSTAYPMVAEGKAERIRDFESGGTSCGKLTPDGHSGQEVGSEGPSHTDSLGRRHVCKRHTKRGRFSFRRKDYSVSEIPLEAQNEIIHKSTGCDPYAVSNEAEDRARTHTVNKHLKTNEVHGYASGLNYGEGIQEAIEGALLSEHLNGILMQDGVRNRLGRSDCDGHVSTLPEEIGHMRRDCKMSTIERSRTATSESDTQRDKNPSNLVSSRLKNSCRVFGKGFLKAARVTGTVLGLAAFALPAMMVIMNACVMDEQLHTLVPT